MSQPAKSLARNHAASPAPDAVSADGAEELKQLRRDLKLTRATFGRMLGCSERGLANWEAGRPIQKIYVNRINELRNLFTELSKSLESASIGDWLLAPNDQFDGLKPVEVIERGETFRLWKVILQSERKL
ncbi:MAG: hypothetical protein ABI680_00215 [Chthoniobacteraceae bacterium]